MAKPRETDSGTAPEVKIIVEKYLVKRPEIDASLKRVFQTLYKGETHTTAEWDEIIKRRLERPAV
jgi:hypothetical protein